MPWKNVPREYAAYSQARDRCRNPRNPKYADYGAQRIEFRFVTYPEFLAEVGLRPSSKHSLDRIDVLGHYASGNVRWVLPSLQNENKRPRTRAMGRLDLIAAYSGPLSFGS